MTIENVEIREMFIRAGYSTEMSLNTGRCSWVAQLRRFSSERRSWLARVGYVSMRRASTGNTKFWKLPGRMEIGVPPFPCSISPLTWTVYFLIWIETCGFSCDPANNSTSICSASENISTECCFVVVSMLWTCQETNTDRVHASAFQWWTIISNLSNFAVKLCAQSMFSSKHLVHLPCDKCCCLLQKLC